VKSVRAPQAYRAEQAAIHRATLIVQVTTTPLGKLPENPAPGDPPVDINTPLGEFTQSQEDKDAIACCPQPIVDGYVQAGASGIPGDRIGGIYPAPGEANAKDLYMYYTKTETKPTSLPLASTKVRHANIMWRVTAVLVDTKIFNILVKDVRGNLPLD